MDPITKALVNTVNSIVSTPVCESCEQQKVALNEHACYTISDPERQKACLQSVRSTCAYPNICNTEGQVIGQARKDQFSAAATEDIVKKLVRTQKTEPTPGKTPYDDRAGDAPEPTPGKTPFDDRAGDTPEPTPTPKPSFIKTELPRKFDPFEFEKIDGSGYFKWKREQEAKKAAKAAAEAAATRQRPQTYRTIGGSNDNIQREIFQDVRDFNNSKPIIPTRSPAPQPAAPATTGSGLLNNIMNFNKKAYKSVTGSLPTMPKIYEERDAEGQMAKGELTVLASKAQELANMMKDDTQLEAWVQSKITKAKDYISSVHDYMNGNPDKID